MVNYKSLKDTLTGEKKKNPPTIGYQKTSVHLCKESPILWNYTGGMDTILLEDIPSVGVLMMESAV